MGTFRIYPICYQQVSGGYLQPEPTMYSRCFCWFPGPLAPSVVLVHKLELSVCCCCDQLLLPGPHYVEWEEVRVDLEEGDDEEEDGLKHETEVETSDPSYMTPPSTRGCSKPSPHPLHSPLPAGSDPENNAALQMLLIEACVEAFLVEADENLKLCHWT